jgi:hypothetical protein
MAHFAQLDENNIVTQVIVVSNEDIKDSIGEENELTGIAFCKSLLGPNTIWKQTSYNANLRKNYAGIGFMYDEERDAFIAPKPYNSWTLNETTCRWEAPIAYPSDGNLYKWDEETTTWLPVTM